MTKAILLAMIVETILIIFIMKGMPCRSSHHGSSQYASLNAIYTDWFISTPRCILEVKQELFLLLLLVLPF